MKPTTITNWEVVGARHQRVRPQFAGGCLSGLPANRDGKSIRTSPVVAAAGRIVTTHSGSRYILGEPMEAYVDWLRGLGVELDDENPLGVRG